MIFMIIMTAIVAAISYMEGSRSCSAAKARKKDVEKARKALKNIAKAVDTNALYLVGDPVASPLMDDIRSEIRNYYERIV
jgi:hypothetical protein